MNFSESIKSVDINCDMGEGIGNDALLMPFISSTNIACGFHAGDETTMKKTVELALRHHVFVGAHPSFKDRDHFGRMEMQLPLTEIHDLLARQVYALKKICDEFGASIHHVKPHGALYNMAAKDNLLAATISKAIKEINPRMVLYGLSGSHLISEAKKTGLKTASEVFADRSYQDDGSLAPRSLPGAIIEDEEKCIRQVLEMIDHNRVIGISGKNIPVNVETICIHGDGRHAVIFAERIFHTLKEKNIAVRYT